MTAKIIPLRPRAAIPITRSKLTNLAMVAGGERKYDKVILDGRVREWVGFGWIDIGEADEQDYMKYPTVVD